MKKKIQLLCILAAPLLLAGCMGYQLGSSAPQGIETVALRPVVNATDEPAIELQVTRALRQRIQFDGRLKLANAAENADAVIEVTLTEYDLVPIAYRKNQTTTPGTYRLRINGVAELKDAESGKTLSKSSTYGEATFPFQSDLTSSKRDALPRAADEIAKFMVNDLIDQW